MEIITLQGAINRLDDFKTEWEKHPISAMMPDVSYHLCCAIGEMESRSR